MPHAERGGYRLYYETHGQGPALLLIRGLGSNLDHWWPQLEAFAAQHQVVVFDNRGVARSTDPDGPLNMAGMAADAATVLDAAGIKRSHLLGVSMGGMIAQELAINHPERIKGIGVSLPRGESSRTLLGPAHLIGQPHDQGGEKIEQHNVGQKHPHKGQHPVDDLLERDVPAHAF